jgi:hypothetical protein
MAIIRITDQLLFEFLQKAMMLPNPVTAFMRTKPGESCFALETIIDGFGLIEEAIPVYRRDGEVVSLIEIRHLEGT